MKKQPEITSKTKQKIIDAFWELSLEKGINKVTVSALVKRANFNRSTFYEYFVDINDLLDQVEQAILQNLIARLEETFSDGMPENLQTFTVKFVEIISPYVDKVFFLMGKDGDPNFMAKLKKQLSKIILSLIGLSQEEPYLEYIAAYMSSAVTGLIAYWYESGQKISLNEMASIAHRLAANGIFGWAGKDTI